MIAGNGEYGPGIGTGYTGEKSGVKKCVKNRVKNEIVLVWDVPWSFWTIQSGSGPEFNKEFDFELKK